MVAMCDSENTAQPNPNMLSYYVQHTIESFQIFWCKTYFAVGVVQAI
jgi:hypothetical protein